MLFYETVPRVSSSSDLLVMSEKISITYYR
jgi:hypothetical protein